MGLCSTISAGLGSGTLAGRVIFPHNAPHLATGAGHPIQIVTTAADIDLQTALARSEGILYSEVDGDVTMMSVENGKYYSLRDVGARIWSLLERPMSPEQICNQLMAEYRVDRERCEGEVIRVMRQMASEGIVERVAAE
jgi:hypothetical protein